MGTAVQRELPMIAVIGGLRELSPDAAKAAAAAAREFGAAMARAGLRILVYDSDPGSVEPHVVAGYAGAAPEDAERGITIRYAQTQEAQVRFAEEADRPVLFDRQAVGNDKWEAGFYRSFSADDGADGLFLLGGGAATFAAGHIGVARKIPVAAVSEFGGAAASIWSEIALRQGDGHARTWTAADADALASWLKAACGSRIAAREELRRLQHWKAQRTRESDFVLTACGAGVLFLAVIGYGLGFAVTPVGVLLSLIAASLLGGTSGALIRAVIWAKERTDRSPAAAGVVGAFAGLIVGIAYIVPILQSAPGLAQPPQAGGAFNLWPLRFNMLSTAAVAFGAGVGFDAIFNRMRDTASALPVGPASDTDIREAPLASGGPHANSP